MRAAFLLLLALITSACGAAHAHEMRPAYLDIREIEPRLYDIFWKTPAQGDMRLALNVIYPDACAPVGAPRSVLVDGAAVQTSRLACAQGLQGQTIVIENLDRTLTNVIVRLTPLQGAPVLLRIAGDTPSLVLPARRTPLQICGDYFRLGAAHIAAGFDHLLFLLCLMLLASTPRRLIGAITAFTLAHSITLAAAALGWVRVASAPVEACIALSIAFAAAEIINAHHGKIGALQRWPQLASFMFGLLHGFGFASALRETGLPQEAAPLALLGFNLGVEAGQLIFVLGGVLLAFLARGLRWRFPEWSWRVAPYGAGVAACAWFIERVAAIFS